MNEVARIEQPTKAPALTPGQMLSIAVEKDADFDKISKLMDLQERWEKNEARKAYNIALTSFKSNPPKITKNKHVNYKSKVGFTNYKHASLDHVCDVVGAALGKVGLAFRWDTKQENNLITVTCVLTHELGHSESTSLFAAPDNTGNKNSIQAVGSTVSYLQRYTLLALTGLAAEDQDNDGRPEKAEQDAASGVDVEALFKEAATIQDLSNAMNTLSPTQKRDFKGAFDARRKELMGEKQ